MEPYLSSNDTKTFYKYLDNSSVYFEYGSGGSTYQASIRKNITTIYSVESDKEWLHKLKSMITHPKIHYIFNDMDTKPKTWGRYGENATSMQKKNYSNRIMNLSTQEQQSIDLILIDGRFRVACCLKCYDIISDDCFIAFDDFLCRPYYNVVLDYFDIVEQNTTDDRMVILKKKRNVAVPKELIEKYELDQR